MPCTLRASGDFTSLFRRGPGPRGGAHLTLLAVFLAAGLSGCVLGNQGLPGGIPQLGSGNLFFATSVMPDGVANRTYNRIIRFQGGIAPFRCTALGALPAGLSVSAGAGPTCLLTGTPVTTGPFTISIQVTDSASRTQVRNSNFTITIRPEFTVPPIALLDAVQGRAYGTAAGTMPQVAQSDVSAAVGNAPLSGCVVTVTGNAALNGSFTANPAPVGPGCPVTSALVATLAPPANAGLMVSFALTDTPILDPDAAGVTVVPAATITLAGQALMADQVLSFSRNLNAALPAVPDAVVARSYGVGPQTALIYTVQGGIPASRSITAGALPGGLACVPALPTLTCTSGAIVGPTGPTTIPITATDGGNSAVLPGAVTTDANGHVTQALTIQAALSIAPFNPLPNGTQNRPYSAQNFVTSGGIQPIANCQSAPALPTGLNITPSGADCSVAGTPTANAPSPGLALNITATDTGNLAVPSGPISTPSNITVNAPLAVTPFVLPNGVQNQTYAPQTITTTGGNTPLTNCAVTVPVAGLPNGLTIAQNSPTTCLISGTPTVTFANQTVTVRVTDSASTATTASTATGSSLFQVTPGIAVTPFALGDGVELRAFNFVVVSTGGTQPLTNCMATGLPAGLSIALTAPSSCTISGTPNLGTSAGNTYAVNVTVTDSGGGVNMASASSNLNIRTQLTFAPGATLGDGVESRAGFSQSFPFSGGLAPVACQISSGALPGGLTLSTVGNTCRISGTPNAGTAPGSPYTFAITVKDTATNTTAFATVPSPTTNTVVNIQLPLVFAPPAALGNGAEGLRAFSQSIPFSGGLAPVNCSNSGGPLPNGLALTTVAGNCVISGTPANGSAGSYNVTLIVTDTGSASTPIGTAPAPTTNSALTIGGPLTLSTVQANLRNALLNFTYNNASPLFTFAASGGTGGFMWKVPPAVQGNCPAALTGTFPTGLAVAASTGVVTGTPTVASATAANFTFDVCVEDGTTASTAGIGVSVTNLVVNVFSDFAYATGATTVEVIDTNGFSLVTSIAMGVSQPSGVAVTPNGRFVFVTRKGDSKFSVIDTITNTQIAGSPFSLPATCTAPTDVAIASNSTIGTLAFIGCTGTVAPAVEELVVIDTTNPGGAPVAAITTGVGSRPESIAVRPDNNRVYVTLNGLNKIFIVSTSVSPPVAVGCTTTTCDLPTTSFSPAGIVVATNSSNSLPYAFIAEQTANLTNTSVVVVDVSTDTPIGGGGPVTSINYASGDKPQRLAAVSGGGQIYVTLNGINRFAVITNAIATPSSVTRKLPDPGMGPPASGTPGGVTIPQINGASTAQIAFITITNLDEIAAIDNAATPVANASSPVAVTAASAPTRIAHVPVPK